MLLILFALLVVSNAFLICTSLTLRARAKRCLGYLSQIGALTTLASELIYDLYQADTLIGTEWPGAHEEVNPNFKDRLSRLSTILGVDFEDLERKVWATGEMKFQEEVNGQND